MDWRLELRMAPALSGSLTHSLPAEGQDSLSLSFCEDQIKVGKKNK